ncbi:MAG: hypothetical protein ACYCZJ_13950 [Sulfuriferula sp.]
MKLNLVTFALSLSSLLSGNSQAEYLIPVDDNDYQQDLHVGTVLLNNAPIIVDIGKLGGGLQSSGPDYFTAASFTTNSATKGDISLDLSINHELHATTKNNSSTILFDFKTLVHLDGYMGDGGKLSVYASAPVNFGVGLRINADHGQALGDPVRINASALYNAFDNGVVIGKSGYTFISFFLNNKHVGTFSGTVDETSFLAHVGDTVQLFGSGQSRISVADASFARGDKVTAFQSNSMKASFTVTPVSEPDTHIIKLADLGLSETIAS